MPAEKIFSLSVSVEHTTHYFSDNTSLESQERKCTLLYQVEYSYQFLIRKVDRAPVYSKGCPRLVTCPGKCKQCRNMSVASDVSSPRCQH